MKRLLSVLRTTEGTAELEPQPGLDAIFPALVNQVRHTGLDVQLSMDRDAIRAPAGIELSAYRVAQEALTNVIKHADARHVRVDVRATTGFVEIDVVDDGRTTAVAGNGHGLVGMRERVALYHDDLEVVAEAEDGLQGVATTRELRPDVVLMDVRMPRLDGIRAAEQILTDPANRSPGADVDHVRRGRVRPRGVAQRRQRLSAEVRPTGRAGASRAAGTRG